MEQASEQSLSTLLKLSSHQFYPQGVTALALLAESHLSIHAWPEHGYAAVDIFTCGEDARPHQACEYLVERFAARQHSLVVLPRGLVPGDRTMAAGNDPPQEVAICQAPE